MNNPKEFWLEMLKHDFGDQTWNTYMHHRCQSKISTLGFDFLNEFGSRFELRDYQTMKPFFDNLEKQYGRPNFPKEDYQCFVDFSKIDFPSDITLSGLAFIGVSFRNTKFQGKVDFRNSIFVLDTAFNNSKFSDHSSDETNKGMDFAEAAFFGKVRFYDCQFSGVTNFNNTEFHKAVYFNNSKFGDLGTNLGTEVRECTFTKSKFMGIANFNNTEFNTVTSFEECQFNQNADFSNSVFGENSLNINAVSSFAKSTFKGDAIFRNTNFKGDSNFKRAIFSGKANFKSSKFQFDVDFDKAKFDDTTNFRQAIFSRPPRFYETEFHPDLDFVNVDWKGTERSYHDTSNNFFDIHDAIRIWDRLALVMGKFERLSEKQQFYKLKMRAIRKRDGNTLLTFLNWLFEKIDYGWSVKKAAGYWFLHILLGGVLLFIPGCFTEFSFLIFLKCMFTSFANAHAFLGLTAVEVGFLFEVKESIKHAYVTEKGYFNSVGAIQTILGPILLFFVLLSLRNRFRLL